MITSGGTATLGLYDNASEIRKKADITYVDSMVGDFQAQVVSLAGGHKGYATLALAQAAQSSLPTNTIVEITNDGANNGTYQWDGTTLTKSAYDPLTQAKSYTDDQIALIPIEQINLDDYSVVIKDKNGIPAVGVLLDKNGKPSIYMLNSIFEGLVDRIAEKVTLGIESVGVSIQETVDGSCFLVDKNQQLSWFGVGKDGEIPAYTQKCILDLIDSSDFSFVPSFVKSTYQTPTKKVISGPDIVCWGDSMTAGAGGNGTTYPGVLKTLMQNAGSTANTYNMGVGGETSPTICARQGGNPFLINVTGGIIPASTTPVTVTLEQINGETVRPLLQGSTTWTGVLDGIAGVLNLVEPSGSSASWQADNYYTFARTAAGTQITIDRPKPFYLDVAAPRLGDIHIIWIGQNGPSTARAISDAKAIIQRMQALDKRYLVISKPTSTDADDSLFFAEFGRRFVAARKYLVQYGLQDAGITPTAQDNTDIANGIVPTSLRADAVHWTAQGYTILANLLFNRIKELGWI